MNRIELISGELLPFAPFNGDYPALWVNLKKGITTPTTAPIKAVVYKQKRINIIFSYYCLN